MNAGWALVAVAVGAAVAAAVAGAGWARRRGRRHDRDRLQAEVRPVLHHILDEGHADLAIVAALPARQQRELESLARAMLSKLRGQDREALARFLDARGALEEARRQTRSRWARARSRASELLGEAGAEDSVSDLVALLRDPNPRVSCSAARALGRLGHPSAVTPLLVALEGHQSLPVDLVADAILQIRECPVSLLRQGLRSRSVRTRAAAVELLGRFQALSATDDMVERLRRDPSVEVRARAARSLGRLSSSRAVDALISCLEHESAPVRAQAAWALGQIAAPQAVPALQATLLGPSPHLSQLAAESLAAIDPFGVAVLRHVAEEIEGRPADTARRALASARRYGEPLVVAG